MTKPEMHPRERERLAELYSYSILDTAPEKEYDNLTALASQICNAPVSMIALIDKDRQWYKSNNNDDSTGSPREIAFCAHTINAVDDVLIVEDMRLDSRFAQNPFVANDPHAVFYAGAKLISRNGLPVGSICVIDLEPRKLTTAQIDALKVLANQTMQLLELKRRNQELEELQQELRNKNEEIQSFASLAAHDLKTPLSQISGVADLFSDLYSAKLDDEGLSLLKIMQDSASSLNSLVDGLLEYSLSDKLAQEEKEIFDLPSFIETIRKPFCYNKKCEITINTSLQDVSINKSALQRIFVNLISNAHKYNDKAVAKIDITTSENETHYLFSVSDNGPGIGKEDHKRLFKMFEVLNQEDANSQKGHGIGLSVIKRLIEKMEGTIEVESEINHGATFRFSILKQHIYAEC
ncbi:sensor histidine kinase [Owenweeksia hongkongensis]|uniref:sensor histidine kinase n=1 Tax=Owenweeksia hongkongensis TaxID=253245 RepID=UPI003A915AFE